MSNTSPEGQSFPASDSTEAVNMTKGTAAAFPSTFDNAGGGLTQFSNLEEIKKSAFDAGQELIASLSDE